GRPQARCPGRAPSAWFGLRRRRSTQNPRESPKGMSITSRLRSAGASARQVADRSSSTVLVCSSKRRHLSRQLIEAGEDFLVARHFGRRLFPEEADGAAGSELGPFNLLERGKALFVSGRFEVDARNQLPLERIF